MSRRAAPVVLAFALGLALAASPSRAAPRRDAKQPYRSLDVLAEVLAYIENDYVEPVAERDLVNAAVEGMVQKLDPHSMILRPDVYRAMRDETSGEFDGVGLEVMPTAEGLVVVAPLADSPAERSGIRAGDRIVAIDGTPAKEMSIGEATRRLKGPPGTQVTIAVTRPGLSAPEPHLIVRDHVRTTSVDGRVLDASSGIAYVRIRTFQDRTDRELRLALDGARKELGAPIRGLVLDLRNDPGGLLEQAVKVADRFLDKGVIVSTEARGKKPEVEEAHERDTEPGYPIALLVNRGSASASEIVAGALQDHGRAVVVGTRTFGKGSVQTVIELEDGSALKLTVARYFTPKHRSIQDKGITPDVAVADGPVAASEAQPGVPEPQSAPQGGTVSGAAHADPQLEKALEVVRGAAMAATNGPNGAQGVTGNALPSGSRRATP